MQLDISTKRFPKTFVVIDDDDFKRVRGYKWNPMMVKKHGLIYVYAQASVDGKMAAMHRFIMGATRGQVVKFINRKTLDCRKANLLIGSWGQMNAARRKARNKGSSKHVGVYFDKLTKLWRASWYVAGKKYRKSFRTESEAAQHYKAMATMHYGPFANLNAAP